MLNALQHELGISKTPHHTTIRQWVLKKGYFQITHQAFEKAKDWVGIYDFTVGVGALKCLLILGVRFNALKDRGVLALSHRDVEVLGIYYTTKTSGVFGNVRMRGCAI